MILKHIGVWILGILLLTALYILFVPSKEGFQAPSQAPSAPAGSSSLTQNRFWSLVAAEKRGGSSYPPGQTGSGPNQPTEALIQSVMNPGPTDKFTVVFPNYVSMYALAKYSYDPIAARNALLNNYDALQTELSTAVSDQTELQQFSADPINTSCANLRGAVTTLLSQLNTLQANMTDLSGTELVAESLHDENLRIQGSVAAACAGSSPMSADCIQLATQDDALFDNTTGLLKSYNAINSNNLIKGADLQDQINSVIQAYSVLNCPIPGAESGSGSSSRSGSSSDYGSMSSLFNTLLSPSYVQGLGLIDTNALTLKLQELSPYYVSPNVIKFISRQIVGGDEYDRQIKTAEGIVADISKVTNNILSLTTELPPGMAYDEKGSGSVSIRICPAGYVCYKNNSTPTLCPAGSYCPAGTTGTPPTCPPNTWSVVGAVAPSGPGGCTGQMPLGYYSLNGVQTICPAGYYCPLNTAKPIACAKGTYNPKTGQSSINDCSGCPAATYCDKSGMKLPSQCPILTSSAILKGTVSTVCKACKPGTYCPSRMSGVIPCPVGTYSDISGALKCTPCIPGTYMPNIRTNSATLAIQCPAGSYCPGGGGQPVPCPPGRFCPGTGLSTNGQICPVGSFCPGGGSAPVTCPIGSICPVTGLSSGNPCPPGDYCPRTGQGSGTDYCAPGTYSTGGAGSGCNRCPAGYSCPTTTQAPIICTAGTYSTGSAISCTPCPSGTFCRQGATAVTPCSPGQYSPGNAGACSECPPGAYCTGSGSMPTLCPVGTYCPNLSGSTSLQCPIGDICPIVGTVNFQSCPPGQYCPTTGLGSKGVLCPAGTFSYGGASLVGDCQKCPIGTFSASGASSCTQCNSGTFCPEGCGPTAWTSIPPGWAATSSTDPSSIYICPPGTDNATSSTVARSCRPCDPQTFARNPGTPNCGPCPSITTTVTTLPPIPSIGGATTGVAGIALASDGSLYCAIVDSGLIYKYTKSSAGVWGAELYAGSVGFKGDANGYRLNQATFYILSGLAVDSIGNIYAVDYIYNTVRMIDTNGNVSLIIGGTNATNGNNPSVFNNTVDGGSARLFHPNGITVDSNDVLYVSDENSNSIKVFTMNGGSASVKLFATGFGGITALACDKDNNIYATDTTNKCVYKITPAGVKTVFSTGYTRPLGIIIIGWIGYVFDNSSSGGVILALNMKTGGTRRVAGTNSGDSDGVGSSASFRLHPTGENYIAGLAFDSANKTLYVSERYQLPGSPTATKISNGRIRAITISEPDLWTQCSGVAV